MILGPFKTHSRSGSPPGSSRGRDRAQRRPRHGSVLLRDGIPRTHRHPPACADTSLLAVLTICVLGPSSRLHTSSMTDRPHKGPPLLRTAAIPGKAVVHRHPPYRPASYEEAGNDQPRCAQGECGNPGTSPNIGLHQLSHRGRIRKMLEDVHGAAAPPFAQTFPGSPRAEAASPASSSVFCIRPPLPGGAAATASPPCARRC